MSTPPQPVDDTPGAGYGRVEGHIRYVLALGTGTDVNGSPYSRLTNTVVTDNGTETFTIRAERAEVFNELASKGSHVTLTGKMTAADGLIVDRFDIDGAPDHKFSVNSALYQPTTRAPAQLSTTTSHPRPNQSTPPVNTIEVDEPSPEHDYPEEYGRPDPDLQGPPVPPPPDQTYPPGPPPDYEIAQPAAPTPDTATGQRRRPIRVITNGVMTI